MRSLLKYPVVLAFASLFIGSATAQDASNVAGGFAFRLTSTSTPSNLTFGVNANTVGVPSQVGVLRIQDDMTVTGTRTLLLPLVEEEGVEHANWTGQLIEQELTGTIDIGDDGMATLELRAEPAVTWYPHLNSGVPPQTGFDLGGSETWRVAFAEGGRRMEILAILPGTRVENPAYEVQILFGGTATATEAAGPADDEIRFPPGRAVGLRDRLEP